MHTPGGFCVGIFHPATISILNSSRGSTSSALYPRPCVVFCWWNFHPGRRNWLSHAGRMRPRPHGRMCPRHCFRICRGRRTTIGRAFRAARKPTNCCRLSAGCVNRASHTPPTSTKTRIIILRLVWWGRRWWSLAVTQADGVRVSFGVRSSQIGGATASFICELQGDSGISFAMYCCVCSIAPAQHGRVATTFCGRQSAARGRWIFWRTLRRPWTRKCPPFIFVNHVYHMVMQLQKKL